MYTVYRVVSDDRFMDKSAEEIESILRLSDVDVYVVIMHANIFCWYGYQIMTSS